MQWPPRSIRTGARGSVRHLKFCDDIAVVFVLTILVETMEGYLNYLLGLTRRRMVDYYSTVMGLGGHATVLL